MEAEGEFACDEERQLAEEMIRQYLVADNQRRQIVVAELEKLNHVLDGLRDRLPNPEHDELHE